MWIPFLAAFFPNFCQLLCFPLTSSARAFCFSIHFSPFCFFFSFSRSDSWSWFGRFGGCGFGMGALGSCGLSDARGTFVEDV